MKTSIFLIWLSMVIVMLALVAACTGLFYQDEGVPFTFVGAERIIQLK